MDLDMIQTHVRLCRLRTNKNILPGFLLVEENEAPLSPWMLRSASTTKNSLHARHLCHGQGTKNEQKVQS